MDDIYGQPIQPVDTRPISFEIQRRRRPNNFDLVWIDGDGVEHVNRELIKFLDANLEVDDALEQMILKLDETERDELKLALLEHDTWTTEFCPALVGVGTGNEALYTMGSGSSAKAVFVYCCTYITKNCAELSAVLSLLYDAKVNIFVPILHFHGQLTLVFVRPGACGGLQISCPRLWHRGPQCAPLLYPIAEQRVRKR